MLKKIVISGLLASFLMGGVVLPALAENNNETPRTSPSPNSSPKNTTPRFDAAAMQAANANIAFAASFRDPTVNAVIADGLSSMQEIFRDYIRKWAPILVRPNFFGERFPGWIVNLFTDLGFWYCQKQCKKKFLDVESMLNKKHAPLFMIHGEFDDYIPPSHQRFLEKISPKKRSVRRLVVPKAGHNEAVMLGRHAYESEIASFLSGL